MTRYRPWSPDMGKSKEEYEASINERNERWRRREGRGFAGRYSKGDGKSKAEIKGSRMAGDKDVSTGGGGEQESQGQSRRERRRLRRERRRRRRMARVERRKRRRERRIERRKRRMARASGGDRIVSDGKPIVSRVRGVRGGGSGADGPPHRVTTYDRGGSKKPVSGSRGQPIIDDRGGRGRPVTGYHPAPPPRPDRGSGDTPVKKPVSGSRGQPTIDDKGGRGRPRVRTEAERKKIELKKRWLADRAREVMRSRGSQSTQGGTKGSGIRSGVRPSFSQDERDIRRGRRTRDDAQDERDRGRRTGDDARAFLKRYRK